MEKELSSDSEGIEKQEQMYVLILRLSDGRHYTEVVNDMKARLKEHENGKCLHTLGLLPVKLVFFLNMRSEQQAQELVDRIRKEGVGFWLEGLRNYALTYQYESS